MSYRYNKWVVANRGREVSKRFRNTGLNQTAARVSGCGGPFTPDKTSPWLSLSHCDVSNLRPFREKKKKLQRDYFFPLTAMTNLRKTRPWERRNKRRKKKEEVEKEEAEKLDVTWKRSVASKEFVFSPRTIFFSLILRWASEPSPAPGDSGAAMTDVRMWDRE